MCFCRGNATSGSHPTTELMGVSTVEASPPPPPQEDGGGLPVSGQPRGSRMGGEYGKVSGIGNWVFFFPVFHS